MAIYSKTNTFSANTLIQSAQVNTNFDEISTAINTTLLAGMTNHGVLVGAGTSSAPAAIAPDSSTTKVLTSGGSSANPTWAAVSGSSFATQTANTVLAGPTSGGAATPTFRALVTADLPSITSEILLTGINGYGATNTLVVRFSNTTVNNGGSDLTYADSSTAGGSITVNTAGRYAIQYSATPTSGGSILTIEKNGTTQSGMTSSSLAYKTQVAQNVGYIINVTTNLAATDVIRFTGDGATLSTSTNTGWARITRLS